MNTSDFVRQGEESRWTNESAGRALLHERAGDSDGPAIFQQVISAALRRKWVIIGSVVVSLLIGLLVTLLMTPQYTATSTVEIRRETGSFINVEGAEPKQSSLDPEYYETQYGLLRASSLAERVASNLRLQDDPVFFQTFKIKAAADWFQNGRVTAGAPSRDARIKLAGSILLKNFSADAPRLSRLVTIRFTSPDPALSKKVVDAWGAAFIQVTLERRFEATAYARRFLEQRLAQLRNRIDVSERQLVDYASQQGIVTLPSAASAGDKAPTPDRSLVVDDLSALNAALSEATADRIRAQSRLKAPAGEVAEAIGNTAISSLRQTRAELAGQYAQMMVQFEPTYPAAAAIKAQIAQLDQSIAREEARVGGTLREAYNASVLREQGLQRQVNNLKSDVLDQRRRSIPYNVLTRDVDTSRQLYDALLQRYKEIGVAGGVGVNNISVVDQAEQPERPSSPNMPVNLALALLAGLVIGVGAAFALEQIDQSIIDPTEVEREMGIPLLGTIPRVANGDLVAALDDRKSAATEAYASVQTNLGFSTDHGIPRTLGVTSTRPAEGKSTTSYALALLIARSKRRVLLIDADMRSPSLHQLMDLSNNRGLSNYLAGDDDLDAFVQHPQEDNMYALTAGPHPPSASELLSSERFGALIAKLLEKFDHIIMDIPPVMGLADAPIVGSRMEGIVFVLESQATQQGMARVALRRMMAANSTLLGVVLTKFDPRRAHIGYGYEYGYGYGYGQNEKSGRD